MRPVDRKAEVDCRIEDMPLVSPGGFAHDQYRAELLLPIVLQLRFEEPTNGLRFVGNRALLVGWQRVHHQSFFRHFKRNNVIVRLLSRRHSHGARPLSWIVCGR